MTQKFKNRYYIFLYMVYFLSEIYYITEKYVANQKNSDKYIILINWYVLSSEKVIDLI